MFKYKVIRNILSCPRGGTFSAIFCPAWWGICRFLRAIKTNPHLYPGVGWVGVYFDRCISLSYFELLIVFKFPQPRVDCSLYPQQISFDPQGSVGSISQAYHLAYHLHVHIAIYLKQKNMCNITDLYSWIWLYRGMEILHRSHLSQQNPIFSDN